MNIQVHCLRNFSKPGHFRGNRTAGPSRSSEGIGSPRNLPIRSQSQRGMERDAEVLVRMQGSEKSVLIDRAIPSSRARGDLQEGRGVLRSVMSSRGLFVMRAPSRISRDPLVDALEHDRMRIQLQSLRHFSLRGGYVPGVASLAGAYPIAGRIHIASVSMIIEREERTMQSHDW